MEISSINTAPPFRGLFPIEDNILSKIMWDIQKNGFDESKPIVLWGDKSIVIDGHTRLRAARKAGLYQVPVVRKSFDNEEAALEYAIKCQRNRRNLKDREIVKCIEELDKRKIAGRPSNEKLASSDANFGKSATETASTLGISTTKVERIRTVMDKGSNEVKEAVKSGKMTINSAYNQTVSSKQPPPKQGTPESLELAAEEIANVQKIIDIINERLNKEQMRELIKRLVKNFTSKFKD